MNDEIQMTVPAGVLGEREEAIASGRDYDLEVSTYRELHQAISGLKPLATVTKLYVKHALARVRKKTELAMLLDINRRTIQRWERAEFK